MRRQHYNDRMHMLWLCADGGTIAALLLRDIRCLDSPPVPYDRYDSFVEVCLPLECMTTESKLSCRVFLMCKNKRRPSAVGSIVIL